METTDHWTPNSTSLFRALSPERVIILLRVLQLGVAEMVFLAPIGVLFWPGHTLCRGQGVLHYLAVVVIPSFSKCADSHPPSSQICVPVTYYLSDFGLVNQSLCASVFTSMKWDNNSTSLIELIPVMCTAHYLVHSKQFINTAYYAHKYKNTSVFIL